MSPPVTSAAVHHVGREKSPVLVIDQVTGDPAAVVELAAALAPFAPAATVAYPGLRRHIGARDAAAASYARQTLGRIAGAINRVFGTDGFDLLDASFSMVTAPPAVLAAEQRIPHFDSPDPAHLAVLHYLSDTPGSGTAFFRQQSTGIERVSADNVAAFVAAARKDSAAATGYIQGSGNGFEQIGHVDGVRDRLIVYQGSLLHSGVIPPGMLFSDDPRRGRLTANFFVRGRPGSAAQAPSR